MVASRAAYNGWPSAWPSLLARRWLALSFGVSGAAAGAANDEVVFFAGTVLAPISAVAVDILDIAISSAAVAT